MALRVGNDGEILVDFTVGGVCCKTNWPRQGVRAGIANHIADDVKGTNIEALKPRLMSLLALGLTPEAECQKQHATSTNVSLPPKGGEVRRCARGCTAPT